MNYNEEFGLILAFALYLGHRDLLLAEAEEFVPVYFR